MESRMVINQSSPLITVFMPVYNTEDFLKEAIESILAQSYSNFELLIIDDGSTDNSINIIESFKDKRIRLVKNKKNMGLPYTRNRGLELAKGEYIAIMDSDDISHEKRLENQLDFLLKNRGIAIIVSNFKLIYGNGKIKKSGMPNWNPEEIKAQLLFRNFILNSSAMIRKDFIKKSGIKYNEEFFACQDYMFWVECLKFGEIYREKKHLLSYRTGHENITSNSKKKKKNARAKLINFIHETALNLFGFELTNSEKNLYYSLFGEENNLNIKNYSDSVDLLKKLIQQNQQKHIFEEKLFGKVVQYNFLFTLLHTKNLGLKDKYKIFFNKDTWFVKDSKLFFFNFARLIKRTVT